MGGGVVVGLVGGRVVFDRDLRGGGLECEFDEKDPTRAEK